MRPILLMLILLIFANAISLASAIFQLFIQIRVREENLVVEHTDLIPMILILTIFNISILTVLAFMIYRTFRKPPSCEKSC